MGAGEEFLRGSKSQQVSSEQDFIGGGGGLFALGAFSPFTRSGFLLSAVVFGGLTFNGIYEDIKNIIDS